MPPQKNHPQIPTKKRNLNPSNLVYPSIFEKILEHFPNISGKCYFIAFDKDSRHSGHLSHK
jgi:hypothetical protein